ncbi:UNVERIFIED_CONTAM: hypothetical protein HDU68_000712 [Siphonaria sp. JEL0065]|nr:hypothetical protein HDU68_000712 [Siphonaria sp. JEL0065]
MSATPIDHDQLAAWIQDGNLKPNEDYLVVDVRDQAEFEKGNIAAVNIPSTEFASDKTPSEKDQQLLSTPKKLIFHCQLSQVRGPTSANNYLKTVGAAEGQEVYVLQGGYANWLEKYGKDSPLVRATEKKAEE